MLITVNPTIDMLSEQQPTIFYLDDGTAVFKCITSPEGVIEANAGSLALQNNGAVWVKTTNNTNTGWVAAGGSTEFANVILGAQTSGAGLDPLQTITIPANILTAAGEGFRLYANGFVTGAAGSHRWTVDFDGVQRIDTGLLAGAIVTWRWSITYVQNAVGSGDIGFEFTGWNAALAQVANLGANVNVAFALNLAHSFVFRAECSNAADTIFQRVSIANKI